MAGSWRCAGSADPRIVDCRGQVRSQGDEAPLEVTAAMVDGRLAILVLRGSIGESGLIRWRDMLSARYGSVLPVTDHGQVSWQWIRTGQMLRLTTRTERGRRVVSVNLVDGPLLDGLSPPAVRPP